MGGIVPPGRRGEGRCLVTARATYPPDDPCADCGAAPEARTCCACGALAVLTDCGHQTQPRPIAAGRADGSDMGRTYCETCARSA